MKIKFFILGRRRCLIEDCVRDLRLNNDHIHIVEQEMRKAIQNGLSQEGHKSSSVKCFPTYVRNLPNGKEHGKFLSLDLGGTNFRVMFLEISKGKIVNEVVEYYSVQEAIRLGYGKDLFDFLAECISDFVNEKLKIDTKFL